VFTEDAIRKTVQRALDLATQSSRVSKGLVLAPERGYIDTYRTPVQIDPLALPLKDKVDLMMEVNKTMLCYEGIRVALFGIHSQTDHKLFGSTLGSRLDITTTFIDPYISAIAVTSEDSQARTLQYEGGAYGWELIERMNLSVRAHQLAEEALMKVHAGTLGPEERRTLIIDPTNLGLTMHESVGHPTELDRVLGWEADFAGISFATPEKLKTYRYGSDIVNFLGDNTLAGGLATAGYDDDGVPGQKWHIVKDGILNEYGTTRETAPLVGETLSRGCNRATYYYNTPINRIPNLYMEPGKNPLTPQDLIADTEDGVYIEGLGSFSIDQHRVNFQFGGNLFYEIKNGKKTRMLKKILYKSNNPEFWNACDAICDDRFFKTVNVCNCGKGQPQQISRMTHGASTARFRDIRVGGSQ
jgi:TldD protein